MKIAAAFDQETRFRTLIGLLQGSLLLLIHELLKRELWPTGHIPWIVCWYTLAIAVSLSLQLTAEHFQTWRPWRFAAGLAALLAALSIYTGRSAFNTMEYDFPAIYGAFGATVILGLFVALPFVQSWLEKGRREFPYPSLFQYAWGDCLAVHVAGFYTSIFWGLLGLWAGLFKMIGIDFFAELFTKRSFIYLATGTAFGFALSFGTSNGKLVTALRTMMLLVFRSLLPLTSFIAVIFLSALPFTGLKPLWDTNHATMLMLNLQLCVILFFNAVYQDGSGKPPSNPVLRLLVEAAIATLPVYAALCVYALGLRIHQYGWSMDRVYASLAVGIAGLYAVGYCACVFQKQKPWMKSAGPINVRIAGLVIALAVLVNTPVLDPKVLSVRSQMGRLLSGKVAPEKFDYDTLRFELGKAGYKATVRLSQLQGHPKAEEIRTRAKAALEKKSRWSNQAEEIVTVERLEKRLKLYPAGKTLDPEFVELLFSIKKDYGNCFTQSGEKNLLLAVDLNRDGRDEIVLFCGHVPQVVFEKKASGWRRAGNLKGAWHPASSVEAREKMLSDSKFQVVNNGWQNLLIGTEKYYVMEAENQDQQPAGIAD